MSKILTNTVKKTAAWMAFLTWIITIAVAIAIILGTKGLGVFNKSTSLDDANTLTVSMNQHAYLTALDTVEDACEEVFGDLDLSYEMKGEMTGDESEIVYVFADDVKLDKVEANLEAKFAELQKADGALEGTFITVAVNSEKTVEVLAKNYALRGVIAALVMVAAVYVYAAIRFGIGKGVLAAVGTLYSMALTASVVIFTRIPVSTSISYVFGAAGMLGAVVSILSLNKIKATEKAEGAEDMYAEEIVVSSLAKKEVAPIFYFTTVALAVLAIIAPANMKWFALSAFVGLVMAMVAGLILVPSLYIPMKAKADNKPKAGYVGAKKSSTKAKKNFDKVATPVVDATEEVAEEVVEETPAAEETPVEEVATEEAVEEATEETVEETATEEVAEAPVEETVAETVEEAPAEEVATEEATEEVAEESKEQE